jgi:uncharacterized glyoxalase superfamily protein PhnB
VSSTSRKKYPEERSEDWPIHLVNDGVEFQLSHEGHFGTPINIRLASAAEVDAFFAKYSARGPDTSAKRESPVHQGPLDQTWGMREFYINDPDGNTLRFSAPAS